ncbi:ABC transporter permease [Cytobacillus firmus]|jgi:oligopeptide transport system permease protein|uniref:ABC transporter permease n=2 Tax=Bacillaceae TaxID=186817 RepID=A0AA46P7B6_CYTFI|nr:MULTISPECIES: ABC transporter permease [Bacillales]MBY6050718.1 ABC transporter permease [Cytobacillus firmus]MCC3645322.1 ABC transporter permease [Cytobacillus oceanisediminis]MCS0651885.1 ABC transporter permease [Cytobacillus firmus]MCU1804908.1 ABC transporter permease [Cytobacillus firmus]URT72233.1 ABC transporter permease [Cytobacillus firmus]
MQISKDKFKLVGTQLGEAEKISKPSLSFWKDVFIRFRKNKLALFGLVLLGLLIFMAIFGPYMTPYDYASNDLSNKNQSPSSEHWFGTDDLGRDMFARTWEGARISIFIGVAAAVIDLIIGVLWGGIAGYKGGRTDEGMMRFADILYGVPYLLLVILLMVVLGQGLSTMIIAMSITGWINMSRIVRGQVLSLKNQEYVLAAKTLGANTSRIMGKHLIPNSMGPILVTMTLTVPSAIFTEAFLSFIGLGLTPPIASWGTMANDGLAAMRYYPWRLFFPAVFICLTIFAFNVVGDGLRDALDPRMRK